METNTKDKQKQLVREQYSKIAEAESKVTSDCCGTECCETIDQVNLAEDYSHLEGYVPDANLGLGCGLPTEYAAMKPGDTVLDLGSGAGNDCFVARSVVGSEGKVIGLDFTEKMIERARSNSEKKGYNNVEFRFGDIENIPVLNDSVDVVISNCVLNLVPDKKTAFQEIFRVLKSGGHFSVSDVILEGELPDSLKEVAELYVGCISSASQKEDYLSIIDETGFNEIKIQKSKEIALPDEFLARYLSTDSIQQFRQSGAKILSVTVYGEKSAKNPNKTAEEACCEPGCCGN